MLSAANILQPHVNAEQAWSASQQSELNPIELNTVITSCPEVVQQYGLLNTLMVITGCYFCQPALEGLTWWNPWKTHKETPLAKHTENPMIFRNVKLVAVVAVLDTVDITIEN